MNILKPLKRLEEIRDRMYSKRYCAGIGGGNTAILCKIVNEAAKELPADVDAYEAHRVLFRISSRLWNRYGVEKSNPLFDREFQKLCRVKNSYWRQYLIESKKKSLRRVTCSE